MPVWIGPIHIFAVLNSLYWIHYLLYPCPENSELSQTPSFKEPKAIFQIKSKAQYRQNKNRPEEKVENVPYFPIIWETPKHFDIFLSWNFLTFEKIGIFFKKKKCLLKKKLDKKLEFLQNRKEIIFSAEHHTTGCSKIKLYSIFSWKKNNLSQLNLNWVVSPGKIHCLLSFVCSNTEQTDCTCHEAFTIKGRTRDNRCLQTYVGVQRSNEKGSVPGFAQLLRAVGSWVPSLTRHPKPGFHHAKDTLHLI